MNGSTRLRSVLVVGSGLIGTSIGLALREAGVDVALQDADPGRVALAVELGAGRAFVAGGRPGDAPTERFTLAVVAVPPAAIASEVLRLQQLDLAQTFTDVGSTKAQPQADGEALGVDFATYVGGHPVAGRERSGPAAGRADLFAGRPWVITATPRAADDAVADVRALALACGAVPVEMLAKDHDAALATVSHLPHLVATLLAAQLVHCADGTVQLGGTGLQDTTRVAAGDPELWTQILSANADHLASALGAFAADAERAAGQLKRIASGDPDAIVELTALLRSGVAGRSRVPVKRGETAGFTTVPIVVRDAPGELAALLRTLADCGINVEDVHLEHEPGRPVGVVEIEVREDATQALIACVRDAGWQLYA
jgi:prephenate dehydrogenase